MSHVIDDKGEKGQDLILPLSASSTTLSSATRSMHKKPNVVRKELLVLLGEFIGTFMFLLIAFLGTQVALDSATINPFVPEGESPAPETPKLLYIAFAFGAGLAINVAIFADVSGGMFNPAVTAALWIVGLIKWQRAVHSVLAQLSGGIASAFVVSALLPGPLPVATVLQPSTSITRGLFLETLMTAQLILVILMLPTGPAKPAYIGFALFAAEICSVYFTGGSLNPARSLGPAVVVGFEGYHWIYWLGPAMGAGLASGTFALLAAIKGQEF